MDPADDRRRLAGRSPSWRRTVDGVAGDATPPPQPGDVKITALPDQIDQYVYWRALGKPWRRAAELSSLDEEQAKIIERTEDFLDEVDATRERITADPASALQELTLQAIGILAEELRGGSSTAAREVLRMTQPAVRTPQARGGRQVPDATGRPEETLDRRRQIETAGRELRRRYGRGQG